MDARDLLSASFGSLSGLPCWNAQRGYSSFITFDSGQPHLEIREPVPDSRREYLRRRLVTVRGDHHLWIEQCDWSLREQSTELAHSESDNETISRALSRLDGAKLETVGASPTRGEFIFKFEFGFVVQTQRYADFGPGDPIWHLYSPGNVVSYLASGALEFGPGDATTPEVIAGRELQLAV